MPSQSLDDLVALLTRLNLVDAGELQHALGQRPPILTADELLDVLERRQLLTRLQTERIRKGETEGLVLGQLKLQYRNASGSFARVYRACTIPGGEMVGVKVLRERWASDPEMVRLFHREGEIGQRLKHRNIVPVYGVFVQGKFHYITMEFVEGGNLRDFLKIRGKLSPQEACRYTLDMAQALDYALGMGITHRDMKMTNVLMSSQGVAKLIDFGLAADESLLKRLGTSDLQQAVEYTTLERGTGAPQNDPRSDLFFLGVILYELLSGVPPYPRTRHVEERKQFHRYRDVRPITAVEPNLPRRAAALVDRLIQINPVERFQSPAQVVSEVRSTLAEVDQRTVAPDESSVEDACSVLCVENRPKQQDLLRQYLSKHGYRVLLLNDVDRALSRLRQQSPDCVLLMGDAIGDRVVGDFQRALMLGRERFMVTVLVLGEKQTHLQPAVPNDNPLGRVLSQPLRLRDLRSAISDGLDVRARYRNGR
jgi:serine/threonine protein kinase